MKKLILFFTTFFLYLHSSFAETAPLTIMLDWQLNPDHAPIWVAKHYGFFTKHGLQVQLIPPSDPSDPAKFVTTNRVDLGIVFMPQWIIQSHQGLPMIWVANLFGKPVSATVTQSSIKTLNEFQGKTFGYSSSFADRLFLQMLLYKSQVPFHSVHLINAHYDNVQALVAGRISGIAAVMRNVEPLLLKQKHFAFNTFFPEDNGVPMYPELIFVANTQLQTDPRLAEFRAALQEGVTYLKQHPQETWQAFAKENPAMADNTNKAIWFFTLDYFSNTPGEYNKAQFDAMKNYLEKMGVMGEID